MLHYAIVAIVSGLIYWSYTHTELSYTIERRILKSNKPLFYILQSCKLVLFVAAVIYARLFIRFIANKLRRIV